MALLDGILYSLPYKKITDVKHTRYYNAQHKDPTMRHWFGYQIIKLDEDVIFYVGWRTDDMNKFHAKKGEYLAQTPTQPPRIYKTWNEVRNNFKIFRKRYRYILSGIVTGTDKVSDFKLIAGTNLNPNYNGDIAIRFEVPDDMELTKQPGDPYSTTRDERTLDELGYDILMWNEDREKWIVHNEYKGLNPNEMPNLYHPHLKHINKENWREPL